MWMASPCYILITELCHAFFDVFSVAQGFIMEHNPLGREQCIVWEQCYDYFQVPAEKHLSQEWWGLNAQLLLHVGLA